MCADFVTLPSAAFRSRRAGPTLVDVPRRPRDFHAGIYHLSARASDTRYLFLTDDDRASFLVRVAVVCERFELALVSYVVMGTHYHLLVSIPDARISVALQQLHTGYSCEHNRIHGRSAHLFRAHFAAREIMSDEDLRNVSCYLALNPVEAGLVERPLDWPWSSAAAHAGLRRPRIPLSELPLRAAFGDRADWRRRYRAHVEALAGAPSPC